MTERRHARGRRKGRSAWYASVGRNLASDRARFIALVSFILLIALTGGSSRPDTQSLLLLRPTAILFFAYALLVISIDQVRQVRGPLLIVGSLMLIALLQLVPLPVALWTKLPNRDVVAEAGALLGMNDLNRPLSLDVNRTWNTFFALFVPLTAICLAAIQRTQFRHRIVLALAGVALLSAAFAFVQAIGGNRLYLYDVSHIGYPVGLFANKNHQSVMLLWLMLAVSWIAATTDARRLSPNAAVGGAIASILVLFPLLVLTGSRAGLLLSVPALALCGWLLIRAPATRNIFQRAGRRAKVMRGLVAAIVIAPLLLIFSILAISERQTALSRLFGVDAAADLRWQYWPIMERMVLDFMPFGSGFGSFETVFNLYEPAETLTSRYMNQAHNDALQLVMEGGLPALIVLVMALLWVGRILWHLWQSRRRDGTTTILFFGGSIALWLTASLVDYPLRTPFAAMLVAALTVQLCFLSSDRRSGSGASAGAGVRVDSRQAR